MWSSDALAGCYDQGEGSGGSAIHGDQKRYEYQPDTHHEPTSFRAEFSRQMPEQARGHREHDDGEKADLQVRFTIRDYRQRDGEEIEAEHQADDRTHGFP